MHAQHRSAEDDDATLAGQCRKGNVEAFETLVERHQKKMLNIAYRMTGDYEDACDIVQEAFLSAYRAIGKFRGEAQFSTWLCGIVMNYARNRIRQAKNISRREGLSIDDPEEWRERAIDGASPFQKESIQEGIENRQRDAKVQECICRLDGEQREIVILRDIHGYSYEEIGCMLNLPDGTVRSRLFRARSALKDHLTKILGDLR